MTMNTEEYNFDDITPVPVIDDNDVVLCKIMYTEEFKTVFGYLRALLLKKELSERALYVACRAIELVPAHYTVWEYKLDIVKKLIETENFNLSDELKWCSNTAINNQKNYQIWHYREMIIELIIKKELDGDKSQYDLEKEREIVGTMLEKDEKNYHVWSYKRWFVQYFSLFNDETELEYATKLIQDDIRNNSAWNFRHFLLFGNPEIKTISTDVLSSEINFTIKMIELSITNPSSWNYMKSLYDMSINVNYDVTDIEKIVYKFSADLDKSKLDQNVERVSIPAFELLSTIYGTQGLSDKQREIFTLLGERLDPIRKNYWAYKSTLL